MGKHINTYIHKCTTRKQTYKHKSTHNLTKHTQHNINHTPAPFSKTQTKHYESIIYVYIQNKTINIIYTNTQKPKYKKHKQQQNQNKIKKNTKQLKQQTHKHKHTTHI